MLLDGGGDLVQISKKTRRPPPFSDLGMLFINDLSTTPHTEGEGVRLDKRRFPVIYRLVLYCRGGHGRVNIFPNASI